MEKQAKTIYHPGRKQIEALKVLKPVEHQQKPKSIEGLFPKDLKHNEIKNELNEIKRLEEKIDRNDLKPINTNITFRNFKR